jgi:hypothetical protein
VTLGPENRPIDPPPRPPWPPQAQPQPQPQSPPPQQAQPQQQWAWETVSGPGGSEYDRADSPGSPRFPRVRATIAVAAALMVAAGGAVAYAANTDGFGSPSSTSAAPLAAPSESAGSSAAPTPSGPAGPGHRMAGGWFGVGRGGDAAHGEATVKGSDGAWVVRVWQHGTVQSADGSTLGVKSEDGTVWTWRTTSDTTVLRNGSRGTGSDGLAKGQTVFLVGTRSADGGNTATTVLSGSPTTGTDTGTGTAPDDRPGDGSGNGTENGSGHGFGRFGHGRPWNDGADSPTPSPSTGADGSSYYS